MQLHLFQPLLHTEPMIFGRMAPGLMEFVIQACSNFLGTEHDPLQHVDQAQRFLETGGEALGQAGGGVGEPHHLGDSGTEAQEEPDLRLVQPAVAAPDIADLLADDVRGVVEVEGAVEEVLTGVDKWLEERDCSGGGPGGFDDRPSTVVGTTGKGV